MTRPIPNPRTPATDIDSMFTDRWSPRSFLADPLTDDQLKTLFEAARWTPSCYNEQPWLFLYATDAADRERFASALVEKNRLWATKAPLLVFVLARLSFAHNGWPVSVARRPTRYWTSRPTNTTSWLPSPSASGTNPKGCRRRWRRWKNRMRGNRRRRWHARGENRWAVGSGRLKVKSFSVTFVRFALDCF